MIKVISRHQGTERVRFVRTDRELERLLIQLTSVPGIYIDVKDNQTSPRAKEDFGKLRCVRLHDNQKTEWVD